MKVAVSFPNFPHKVEVELAHTVIMEKGKPKEIYRGLVKHPKTGERYIAIYDPATGEVKLNKM